MSTPPSARRPVMTYQQWFVRSLVFMVLCVNVPLALIGPFLVWYFFVPMYRAEAWLEIRSRAPYIAFPSHEDWQAFVRTQVELIRSPLVLSPVLAKPDIAAFEEIARQMDRDPDAWLRQKIEVKSVGQSELYVVSFEGPNPEHSKRIVDAVVESYFAVRGQDDADKSSKVIELLKDQKRARETSVQRYREAYKTLYMRATGKDPFVVNANPIGAAEYPLYELENKLMTAEIEWEVQKAILSAVEETANKPLEEQYRVPDWQVEQALKSRPEIVAKESQLAMDRARLRELDSKLASKDEPLRASLEGEIAEGEEELAELRVEKREEVREELEAERASKREAELARMRLLVESFEQTVKALQKQYDEKRKELKGFSGDSVEIELAQEDYRRAQEVYQRIADRIDVLETEQAAPARVILRRSADLPELPVQAFPLKRLAAVSGACFLLPFVVLIAWGLRRPSRLEDAVFGYIRYFWPRTWRGEVELDSDEEIDLVIHAPKKGPTDAHRRAFVELRRRYPELKPAVSEALFRVYGEHHRDSAGPESRPTPQLDLPAEVWSHTRLEGMRMELARDSDVPRFMLVYSVDWDEDLAVEVFVWDWQVVRAAVVGG